MELRCMGESLKQFSLSVKIFYDNYLLLITGCGRK